jgi:P27 family predicted phage terminase small subunit
MGKRGPAKTPAAVNKMRGNPGKRSEVPATKASRGAASLQPPKCLKLNRADKAVFREVVKLLETVPDLLGDVDAFAVGLLCEAVAERNEAKAEIEKDGATCVSEKGSPYLHPAVGRKNAATKQIVTLMAKFGMTPSDRTAQDLAAKTTAGSSNRFEAFLNQSLGN